MKDFHKLQHVRTKHRKTCEKYLPRNIAWFESMWAEYIANASLEVANWGKIAKRSSDAGDWEKFHDWKEIKRDYEKGLAEIVRKLKWKVDQHLQLPAVES